MLIGTPLLAAMYSGTPEKQVVSVGTTGQITTLTGSGVVTIYAPSLIYYELTAATPSITDSPAAGGTDAPKYINTEQRYFVGDKIGLRSASGTVKAILIFQEPN